MIQFYNIITSENSGVYFSPYGCRILLALKHKGLQFKQIGLTYSKVGSKVTKLTDGQWDKVPLIIDNQNIIYESDTIAKYLEDAYPSKPLFPNGKPFSKFIQTLFDTFSTSGKKFLILGLYELLDDKEKNYFRIKNENNLGMSLEQFSDKSQTIIDEFDKVLSVFRITLSKSKYLEGEQVTYSDYILFSFLNNIKVIALDVFDKFITKHEDNSLKVWYESIKKLYKDLVSILG